MVATGGEAFGAAEKQLSGDILRTLIRDVERSVRAALAANLAASAAAPRDVIISLANDEIEVAFMVLAESPVLTDEDLKAVVVARTTGHRIAIAMRPTLSEGVADCLVETGDKEALACLLHNNEAAITQASLGRLVGDARKIEPYRAPLAGRPDLGRTLASKLAAIVTKIHQERLIAAYDLDPQAVEKAAAAASIDATDDLSGRPPDHGDVHSARRRDVRQMIETLRRGEWPHFEAAMVRFSGLPTSLTHNILAERDGRRLTVLCLAYGVQKSDFAPLFLLSRRATPDVEVVDAADVRGALALFDSIDRAAATRAVARWRAEAASKGKKRFGGR